MSKNKESMWRLGGLTWKELLKRVWKDFNADRMTDQAAQLSYYFIFALFPALLFLTALLGLFLEPGSVLHQAITQYVGRVAPKSASGLIDTVLKELFHNSGAGKVSLGALVALWSASSGMAALINSLNIAYEAREPRPWWKEKLLAIALTIVFSAMVIVALVLAVYGGTIADTVSEALKLGPVVAWAWTVLQWPVLLFLLLIAFNLVYYFGPNVRHTGWHWVMPGTAAALAIWIVASVALKLYLSYFNSYSVTYGSIGAVIILLLWLYIFGIALLWGGEMNSEIEKAIKARTAPNTPS